MMIDRTDIWAFVTSCHAHLEAGCGSCSFRLLTARVVSREGRSTRPDCGWLVTPSALRSAAAWYSNTPSPSTVPSAFEGTNRCSDKPGQPACPEFATRGVRELFRAITRAITPGQSGGSTVTHGRSREGTWLHQTDKTAAQRWSDLRLRGGQGRGRTADLPIFSRRFGATACRRELGGPSRPANFTAAGQVAGGVALTGQSLGADGCSSLVAAAGGTHDRGGGLDWVRRSRLARRGGVNRVVAVNARASR